VIIEVRLRLLRNIPSMLEFVLGAFVGKGRSAKK